MVQTAYDPAPHNHSQYNQWRTPYAVVHGLVLLMMGIMMPETCWDRSLIINIELVASCWLLSLSLHPMFMMHGHKNLKLSTRVIKTVVQNSKICRPWSRFTKRHHSSFHFAGTVQRLKIPTEHHAYSTSLRIYNRLHIIYIYFFKGKSRNWQVQIYNFKKVF